jgi:hypothetical protein
MNEAMRSDTSPPANGAEASMKADLPRRITRELEHAKDSATDVANGLTERAKEHPYVTAGVLFGSGLLFGALAYRAFYRPPTASEIFTAAMKRAAIDARHTLATGLTAARRFVK